MTWSYRAPAWLGSGDAFGGHLQTLWPALIAGPLSPYRPNWLRQRWHLPDGDFIDTDFLQPPAAPARPDGQLALPAPSGVAPVTPPLLVLFHGLEGSVHSHYVQAFAQHVQALGWLMAVPHFRGCSGALNLAPRSYHAGDFEDIDWMLQRCREQHPGDIVVVGISLGGNALLRWAQEWGYLAQRQVCALAAISAPLDLNASGHALAQGLNRLFYTRAFLKSLKPKALAKLAQYPDLADAARIQAAHSLQAFDDAFTGPLHGFTDCADYWTRSAAKPGLPRIRVPSLLINARNDPFVPQDSLPGAHDVGRHVTLWQPPTGGHVGFPDPDSALGMTALPKAVTDWFQRFL